MTPPNLVIYGATGYSGSEVQISVQKHVGADSNEAMAEAKRDVKLDISQQGNYVRLYVDGDPSLVTRSRNRQTSQVRHIWR